LLGRETFSSFKNFNPNIVLIGVSGLNLEKGLFCHGNDEVNVKSMLFDKKGTKILIPVDYSKLGKADSYSFGSIDNFISNKSSETILIICPPIETEENGNYKHDLSNYKKFMKKLKMNNVVYREVPSKVIEIVKILEKKNDK
jgi:hypothetical protein